jgi:hypothetical protein
MVLHDREHDLVAGLDALVPECIGDQVDGPVALRVKTISSARLALRNARTLLARAPRRLRRRIGDDSAGRDAH